MRILVLLTVGALAACSSSPEASAGSAAAKTPLNGRARDSVIAASRLPGATGVGNALRASDAAAARAARLDSASGTP